MPQNDHLVNRGLSLICEFFPTHETPEEALASVSECESAPVSPLDTFDLPP